MKLILAGGVAAAALFGVAHADNYSGYVGVSHDWLNADDAGVEGNATTVTAAGAFDLRGHFQTQVDAEISDVDDGGDPVYGGTIHVVRRADGWMVGAFVGGVKQDDASGSVVGAEGALYFKRFTLAGAIGYADSDNADGDGPMVQVEGRYFIDRNLRIDATAEFATFNTSAGDFDATSLGVGGEYKFTGSAFSIYGGYSNLDTDISDVNADIWTLGFRVNLDDDLAARDEHGASLLRVGELNHLF